MKLLNNKASSLYLVNATLLATHEIDSAYWHEWELFHLPGGITLFLVLNFVLLWLIFFGFVYIILQAPKARMISGLLASAGIFTFVIHSVFILLGNIQFRTSISIGLLFAILLVSILQLIDALSTNQSEQYLKTGHAA